MTDTNKSGKGRNTKVARKKTSAGTRPAKPGKRASATVGTARQRNTDRWRELVETSAAWIWKTDAAIRHTYTNAFVARCLGYQPAEFLSLNTLDLVHPDDRGLIQEIVQNAVTRKEGWFDQVLRWRHKDGSWKDIESSGSALYDEQGTFIGLCGVDRDIIEQMRAAEDLRRSEEKYRDLFENAMDAICIIDRNQNYVDVNRRTSELFGYSREELLSMNVRDMLPPGQLARSEKEFEKLTESGAYEKFTGRVRKKDGSYIDVEVNSSAIVEQGQVVGSRDIIRDITERRKAEALLRDSESRMRSIVESSPVGMHMYRLEPDGRLIFIGANPAADRILGVDNSAFIGQTIEDAFPPLKETEVPQRYRDVARSGKAWQTESIEYHDNAIKGAFEVHAFAVAPNSMVAAFQDITDRKLAEEALRASEGRYRAIVESQAEFIVRYQPGGIVTFVNDTLCRYAKMKREDLLGRSYYPLMHPDDRDAFIRKIEALDRKSPDMVAEARMVLPDGRESWHQWAHHAIFDDQGKVIEYQATGRDVTEIREAEKRLRESEEKFSKIFKQAPLLITLSELETGRFLDVNEKFLEVSGFAREEVVGRTAIEIGWISEEQRARMRESMRERGRVFGMELSLRRKDNREVLCLYDGEMITVGGMRRLLSIAQDITERKRAEEELREKENRYRMLFEAANDGIFIQDSTGFRDCNQRGAEMYGLPKEQLIGRSPAEFAPERQPDGRLSAEVAAEKIQGALNGVPQVFEWQPLRADGTPFDVEITLSRLELGGSAYLQAIVRDITERKRVQEALRKSEKMLKTIIDAEPECVKLLDENANLIMMNRAGLDMLEVASLDQIRGQCVCPLVTSEYRQEFLDLTKRVFQGGSGTLMFEMVGLKGRHLWMETHAVPLRNEKDEIVAVLGVTRDITERKRAGEALRLSEARFRAIIENASVGILVADIETKKFRYANPQICRLLGYSEQDFRSLTVMDLVIPEEQTGSIAGFQAHVEGKLNVTERTLRRKDGSSVRMSINSVSMVFDGLPCLVGFFADITEKQLLEEERLKAQKLESIGTLAGGIAHDFNNLLQGIFGYISMAKLTIDQREKSLAMLVLAEKALHQSVNLTSQLLTFSKGGKPVKKAVDLRPVIEDAVKFALSGSRVSYDLSFGDDLCAVDADEGQIGQVVQNIVLNAEQAMPLGGRIEIAARNVPRILAAGLPFAAPDGLVEIVVRDQGTGIPPEHLPRIFDPYFTTKEKGSGLGLATSYAIVRNHGGMITVSSDLGKGSTFNVILPASSLAPEAPRRGEAPRRARRGRVLVMDDEDVVRQVAEVLLRELGHETEFAEHGDSAIEKYRRAKAEGRPFDVVILDLTIRGGKGGAETLRELLEIDPGVKAVVSSGYSDDEVVATYRQHGFCSFLKKPYNMQELGRMLDEAMA